MAACICSVVGMSSLFLIYNMTILTEHPCFAIASHIGMFLKYTTYIYKISYYYTVAYHLACYFSLELVISSGLNKMIYM